MDANDYKELFEQSSALMVVLDTNFTIVSASDAYLRSVDKLRENIVGQDIFSVFQDNPGEITADGVNNIQTSLNRVIKNKTADAITIINDIQEPESKGGNFVLKYWKFCHSPVFDPDNKVKFIIQRVEDITENKALIAQPIAYEVTETVLARQKAEESDAFYRSILDNSPDCIKILDAEGRLEFMNTNGICLMEIDDFRKFKDKYWWDLWEEKNQQMIKDAIKEVLTGKRVQFQAFGATAKGTPKWWDVIVLPILIDEQTGKVQRILSVSRDITDYKEATLKVEESEHRYHEMMLRKMDY